MSVNPHESELDFIRRAESLPVVVGPYHELTDELVKTVEASPDALMPLPGSVNNDQLTSQQTTFQYDQTKGVTDNGYARMNGGKTAKALLRRSVDEKGAFDERGISYELLFDDDVASHEAYIFSLTADGYIEGTSVDANEFLGTEKGGRLIRTALEKLTQDISHRQANITRDRREEAYMKREKRRRIISRTVKSIGGLVTAGALTAGSIWGYNHFIAEPRQERAQAEKLYDSQQHVLQGEGLQLQRVKVSEMTNADFDAVPDYEDGDTLASPRTIGIEGNSCKTLDNIKPTADQQLFAAIAKDSSLRGSIITAATNEGGHLHICLDGPDTGRNSKELAIQLRQLDAVTQ